jgi:hypothetical protein
MPGLALLIGLVSEERGMPQTYWEVDEVPSILVHIPLIILTGFRSIDNGCPHSQWAGTNASENDFIGLFGL